MKTVAYACRDTSNVDGKIGLCKPGAVVEAAPIPEPTPAPDRRECDLDGNGTVSEGEVNEMIWFLGELAAGRQSFNPRFDVNNDNSIDAQDALFCTVNRAEDRENEVQDPQ